MSTSEHVLKEVRKSNSMNEFMQTLQTQGDVWTLSGNRYIKNTSPDKRIRPVRESVEDFLLKLATEKEKLTGILIDDQCQLDAQTLNEIGLKPCHTLRVNGSTLTGYKFNSSVNTNQYVLPSDLDWRAWQRYSSKKNN